MPFQHALMLPAIQLPVPAVFGQTLRTQGAVVAIFRARGIAMIELVVFLLHAAAIQDRTCRASVLIVLRVIHESGSIEASCLLRLTVLVRLGHIGFYAFVFAGFQMTTV